jgi:L-methionine (R)-S-oxide reductase
MERSDVGEKYALLLKEADSYAEEQEDGALVHRITVLSHLLNGLKRSFPYMDWVGVYLKEKEKNLLYLGPYVGEPGCDLIPYGKGVCGTVASAGKTLRVQDVRTLTNYIACASSTLSEIVLPMNEEDGSLYGVLDIDSDTLGAFTETDEKYLCGIVSSLMKIRL